MGGLTRAGGVAARLDLPAIEVSLRRVQVAPAVTGGARDPLDERVLDNLLAGYARVDELVAGSVDVLAMGRLKHLLELNSLVLCGASQERRVAYARHLEATERRFYGEGADGVGEVVEWAAAHQDDPPRERAAGVYVMILSRPQLFIEGNHRTGALVMSCLLARAGLPPFVLSPECAEGYFDVSTCIRDTAKTGAARFRLGALQTRLAALLGEHIDPRHVIG
ncbi:MAG TPA: hypothetical protein VN323_19515 [Candidatus Dormibacteraeota bacterium]|nr:hypothetical protein [Candidatus Dormibacteraeota bacterium]